MKKNLLYTQTDRGPKRSLIVFFCAVVFILCAAGGARAQYREDPINRDLANRKSDLGSGDEAAIAEYAKGFYLARWTQRENLSKLHVLRRETASDVAALRSENKKTCQRVLVGLFAEMAQAEDLMPAVRYNAALAMGMFNEREAGTGGGGDTGVPYAPAIRTMTDIFNAGEGDAKGNRVPDYVVLAILISLDRYAALGIADPADKKAVTDVFLQTLDPAFGKKRNYPAETTAWFQKKAVDGLAAFESPSQGENDTVILDTFIRLLRDKSVDSTVQCAALRGIGTMKFTGKDDFDFEPLVSAVARAALSLNQKEIAFIDEENIRSQVESTQGGGRTGGALPTMAGGSSANTETVVSRVKFDAESLRTAIDGGNGKGGILPLLTKESQAPLKEALESLLGRIDRTNNYLDFGEQGIADDFDPKKVKRPKSAKGAELVFYVNSTMVRYFLADETDFYQDLAESLTAAEAEKQR